MKAYVLKGDPKPPIIVASSVYDTKSVHYISMVSSDLKWVVTEKYVFNVDSGITETLRFYVLKIFIITTSPWVFWPLHINLEVPIVLIIG